jgi:hypothetical protein
MTLFADMARGIGRVASGAAGNAAFRLRLLRMVLCPMSRIPAALVVALDTPDYDYGCADDRVAVR